MLTQAQPIEIAREKRGLCRCVSKNAGGRGKMGEKSGGRRAAARRVKNPRKFCRTSFFSFFPFFSLFSIYLYLSISNRINNLHFRRARFGVPNIKKRGTNPDTKFSQPLDFVRLFLCQHFAPADTSDTRAGTSRTRLEKTSPGPLRIPPLEDQ
jgi:hypothetical protein